jgi:hypothetical protein
VPFRVFGDVARRGALPPPGRPLGIRASFRVLNPGKYRGYWFRDPALPLAIPSALRFFLDGPRRPQLSDQCILSASSTFLQSLAQRHLVSPPEPADTSHGLLVPYSTSGSGGPLSAGLATARYVPPAGFGYPLGGLLPPRPCRLCFTPAALLGFALRSFLLAEGIRRVSAGKDPLAVPPVGIPAAGAMGRPNRPRLLGFSPSESPWRSDGD